ncbi:hypothetical protein CJI97_002213 [Candidozyma auris]|nr:hypothetical protein CJI97_002213 [[Candida] auris]
MMASVEERKNIASMTEPMKVESSIPAKRQANIDDFTMRRVKIANADDMGEDQLSQHHDVIEIEDNEDTRGLPTPSSSSQRSDHCENDSFVKGDSPKAQDSTSPSAFQGTVEPKDQEETPQETGRKHKGHQLQAEQNTVQVSEEEAKALSKKQLERLEKSRIREQEKIMREKKKEEERRIKQLERERKEQERLMKKQMIEREKERKREEERQRKEEKKRKLEEEKKRKELERQKKEEEKKRKEEERKQQEEERKRQEQQKERSQMKISSFFSVKAGPSTPKKESSSVINAKAKSPAKDEDPYERQFLPFFVKKNAVMAASQQLSEENLKTSISKFDQELGSSTQKDLSIMFSKPAPISSSQAFVTSEQLFEAFDSTATSESALRSLFASIPPIKYLHFYENAKPPYIGTWCSQKHMTTKFEPVNPLDTSKTGMDYDYDSDLDWQEGDDEGEDIDDLEEGEGDEDDIGEEEDMGDFVEDNNEGKKKLILGPMEPITIVNDGSDPNAFANFEVDSLNIKIDFPINPFRDYWNNGETETPQKPQITVVSAANQQHATPMKSSSPGQATNVLTPQRPTIKDKAVVQQLIAFIEKNADFTIGTLSELAKKEFKNYTKSILKHTIQEVALYNKKQSVWEIKPEVKEQN